jgi:transposase
MEEKPMERRLKVELFEQIRRKYEHGCGTIVGTAQKFGVHRRMVRQAIESALPPERKKPERKRTKFDLVKDFIERILREDERAPRKQRHTAHRIFVRLQAELPGRDVSERSVRKYVEEIRAAIGLARREVFVPQHYEYGAEAQVDWYEATVCLGGVNQVLQFFCLRASASGAAFHRAYLRATQTAFLEAHELAFQYFGGVFRKLRYDNLKAAVKRILRGSRREETTRFIAFRSHYGYQGSFCNPFSGHEKGGVEGEVGRFRRNHLVPVPQFASLEKLNEWLLEECRADEKRFIEGHSLSVEAGLIFERAALLALPDQRFELAEECFLLVDAKGCVRVKTNLYSTPLKPHTRCRVRLLPTLLEVWFAGKRVAEHERSYLKKQEVYALEHYLDVLARKPGAFPGSKPLHQWRLEGRWTAEFDRLFEQLQLRHGAGRGTRLMIELLREGKRVGYERLRQAVTRALELGAGEAEAVTYLLGQAELERFVERARLPKTDDVRLSANLSRHFYRPLPEVADYDGLLMNRAALDRQAEVTR